MLKVLLSSRMLAFHGMVLLLVPAFIWLGFWQLDRWEQRSAAVNLQQENLAADPVPVDELTEVGTDVSPEDRWRTVAASGTWDTDNELLLRNREGSDGIGFHVLTPLVTEDGTALLVNRGWIPRGDTATETPDPPPAPEGGVKVAGRLHFAETEENTGLRDHDDVPDGQIMIVDVDGLADELPYPVYGGFIELTDQEPFPDPAPDRVGLQEEDSGMSLSYAVQWWVFTLVAIGGWAFLIRRELKEAGHGGPPAGTAPGDAGEGGGPGRGGGDGTGGGTGGAGDTGSADQGADADANASARTEETV